MTLIAEVEPFDPSIPELITDPYRVFAHIRENDPFHRSKFGYWVVSRYDDVREVLMNRKDFGTGDFINNLRMFYGADFDVMSHSGYRWLSEVFIAQDPPQHTRIRGLVTGSLTAKRVRAMLPRVEEICTELTDAFAADGHADLMTQFAYRLPVMVICDLMGIDYRDPAIEGLIAAIPEAFVVFEARKLTDDELANADRGIDLLEAFFLAQFEDRLANPRDDLLTALAQTGSTPGGLTMHEATTIAIALFGAGFETTANIIGNGLYHLHRQHDQWEQLVADPAGLAASTGEEVLRYESSLVAAYRTALHDTEVAGHAVKAGERVLTLVGAGNRDGRKFPDPERFDVRRGASDHLSFGGGIHFCVGAELARMEGRIAFEHLARTFPTMTVDVDKAVWRENFLFRGLTRLDATW